MNIPSFAKNREERRKENKIVELVYNAIFRMSDKDLLLHYEEIKKELEKRGIYNVWRCRNFTRSVNRDNAFYYSFYISYESSLQHVIW